MERSLTGTPTLAASHSRVKSPEPVPSLERCGPLAAVHEMTFSARILFQLNP
jgi:hypothetical protein